MEDLTGREGGDITADHMVDEDLGPSEIEAFYKGAVILLTGATGFLGKIILEKLLRSCKDLEKVFIIIRDKKGRSTRERLDELFQSEAFGPLKRRNPNFREKVFALNGDISEENLGLSGDDMRILSEEITSIIHCAASVRFDQKLKSATCTNIRSVRDLITLAKSMKNLKSFVYISTAFSNCIYDDIDEKFYKPELTGQQLLDLVDLLDESYIDKITPAILGSYPNTYILTKAAAENLIQEQAKNLPITIVRPSIILSSHKEPVAGWLDSFFAFSAFLLAIGIGFVRIAKIPKNKASDIIPADYVSNMVVAAGWYVGTLKSTNENKEVLSNNEEEKWSSETPIFNCVSTADNPITHEEYIRLMLKTVPSSASVKMIWYPNYNVTTNKFVYLFYLYTVHYFPAVIIDLAFMLARHKPWALRLHKRINGFQKMAEYFCCGRWKFHNNNAKMLWSKMLPKDKENFNFDIGSLNWKSYFYTSSRGLRVYLGKDPLETLERGKRRYYILKYLHYTLVSLMYVFIFYILYKLVLLYFG